MIMSASAAMETHSIPGHLLKTAAAMEKDSIPWDGSVKFAKRLVIDALSYQEWIHRELPWSMGLPVTPPGDKTRCKKVGSYLLYNLRVPRFSYESRWLGFFMASRPSWEMTSLKLHDSPTREGAVYFTGDVTIPVLADSDLKPWMSPTPNEAITLRRGLRFARGRVLVGGLGMGWFAKECSFRDGVTVVVVIEKDPAILLEFAGHLPENVRCIGGDAFLYADQNMDEFDSILFDVWPSVGDAGWDRDWQRLKASARKAGKSVWGWTDWKPRD
jgi:hypothetical protein